MAANRRLAAIMFTDLEGFTSETQKDEAGALRLLEEQDVLVRPVLLAHRGRTVKSMGDGLLIEFPNVLDAVECSVELQRSIHERNSREGARPLRMRIGIHLGDVLERGTDILGDAVNVASRIEAFAEAGGVCLTSQVFEQVHSKVAYQLKRLGPKSLKGVRGPVEVYRVVLPWTEIETGAGGVSLPRLAVLPLANISPDPRDEYFADGLTEELITTLSQLHGLRVIARTSVMPYKSVMKPITEIGRELAVSSVLEGTVRKAGNRLRITAQLIDVPSQEHTWSETFDRDLEDVFDVQTEVARRIAEALKIKIGASEEMRLEGRSPVHPESYLAYLRGRTILSSSWSEEEFRAARQEFERAISLDAKNAAAYAGLADAVQLLGDLFPAGSWDESNRVSRDYAARAIELDPNLAEAHCSLAGILWGENRDDEAEKEFERTLSLNPSYAQAHMWYAALLEDHARSEEALRELTLAEESDPHSTPILTSLVELLIWLRRLDDVSVKLEKLRTLDRGGSTYYGLLAQYYCARSDLVRAWEAADRREQLKPGDSWRDRVLIYAVSGETEKARELIRREEARAERLPEIMFAVAYGRIGDLDQCFRWLDLGIENHRIGLRLLQIDPLLESVRKDPRFAELLKKMSIGS